MVEKNENVRELERLREEIDQLQAQGISPPLTWYEERFHHLVTYSELGWASMAERFHGLDRYIENTSLNILHNLEDLVESFYQNGHFNLRHYQHLLHDIETLWNYYQTTYLGEESDPEVGDLIVGLTHLMRNL